MSPIIPPVASALMLMLAAGLPPCAAQQIANPSVISRHQPAVDTLQRLSVERAERQATTIPDPRGIAMRCVAQLEQARTYGSLSRILDRGAPKLAARGYARVTWTIDHVEPGRHHVLQVAWDDQAEVYDEWIAIGDREFVLLATWLEMPRPGRQELGKQLSVRKYAPVLRDQQPLSAVSYSYAGKPYVLLTYRHPIQGDFAGLFPGFAGSVGLELWIDSASALLAKARMVPTSAPTGVVPPELEEVFVGYSDDIRIDAPPLGASKIQESSDTSRGAFRTLDDVSSFAQTYYQRPRPDLIADLFSALQPTGVSEQPNSVPPFVGFFSEVFAANSGRLAEWQALVPKQEASTRRLLYQALELSRTGGVLTIEGHSPAINDMYWGAFGASGRTTYLQKLVDQLRYWDERDDQLLFFAGATAKWSLASNALSDSLVRATLAGQTLTTDQRTRALVDELLRAEPERVKQEMAEVVRQQREAGKWP